jgi:hypothetical protein
MREGYRPVSDPIPSKGMGLRSVLRVRRACYKPVADQTQPEPLRWLSGYDKSEYIGTSGYVASLDLYGQWLIGA